MKAKDIFYFLIIGIAAFIAVVITFNYLLAFSGFAAGLLKAVIGIALFYSFDKIVLKEVDTIDEIVTHKNIAYALFIFSFALILAATIATA